MLKTKFWKYFCWEEFLIHVKKKISFDCSKYAYRNAFIHIIPVKHSRSVVRQEYKPLDGCDVFICIHKKFPICLKNITCTSTVAAKPAYSTNTTYNATPRVIAQPKVQAPIQASSAATYVYPTVVTSQQPASSYSTTYAGTSNATTTVSYTSKGKNSFQC